MTTRSTGILRGLGVPWALWTPDAVLASPHSAYSQAGGRPGTALAADPRSKMLPVVLGEQTSDIDHAAARSGSVGGRWDRALAVAYRPTGAATWRGWEGPGTVTWYSGLDPVAITPVIYGPQAVRLRSGRVLVVHFTGTAPHTLAATRIDPRDCSRTLVQIQTMTTALCHAVTVLPDGRVLVLVQHFDAVTAASYWWSWYSDDEGATWTLYDRAPFEGAFGVDPDLAASSNPAAWSANTRGEVLFLRGNGVSATQYASSALGTSLGPVGAWSSGGPVKFSLSALSTGGWLLAYVEDTTNLLRVKRVASASLPVASVASVTVAGAATFADVACWESADGRLYVMGATTSDTTRLYYSDDGGATWTAAQGSGRFGGDPLRQGDNATRPYDMSAVEAGGAVWLAHSALDAGGGPADVSRRVVRLGGWEDVEHSGGWVGSGVSLQYVPWEVPDTIAAWAATGAGTALKDTTGLRITTAANTKFWRSTFTNGFRSFVASGETRLTSGGSVASNVVSVRVFVGDGATTAQCDLRFSTTQVRLVEGAVAVTLGTATVSTTTALQWKIWVQYLSGTSHTVTAWYRRAGETVWTLIGSGAMTTSAGATSPYIEWGHRANTTSESIWGFVSIRDATDARTGLGTINGAPAALLGRQVPEVSTATSPCALAVRQGPGRVTETHTIARTYDYPLSNIFPEVSPSPTARGWRSVGTGSAVNLAAAGARALTAGSSSLALYIGGANFKTAHLQTYDGFAWTTIGTWNAALGFDGVGSWRQGDMLTPDYIFGVDGGRYLQYGEKVGGTAVIGGTAYRRIAHQPAGWWSQGPEVSQRKASIRLEGEDGTSATFSTCELWSTSGVLVVHNVPRTILGIRVQIPSQTTYDGDLRAGVVMVTAIQPFGRRFSRGGQIGYEEAIDTRTDAYGTERIRQTGPRRRVASFAWTDPVSLTELRRATPGPFFAADNATLAPLQAIGDVPWLLDGIQRETRSGERPVLYLPSIPNTDAMITDPTLFLYGRMRVGETTHALGEEGSNELVRVAEVQIREIA